MVREGYRQKNTKIVTEIHAQTGRDTDTPREKEKNAFGLRLVMMEEK